MQKKRWLFIVFLWGAFQMASAGHGHSTEIISERISEGTQNPTDSSARLWFKIRAKNKIERSRIANLGIAIDRVTDDFVYGTGRESDRKKLTEAGVLDVSFELTSRMQTPVDPGYRNYNQLTEALKGLVKKYSEVATLGSLGRSFEGREIWVLRISGHLDSAKNLPGILYVGGHHAREHLSVEVPLGYAEKLLEQYAAGEKRIVSLLDSRDIHIIPALNPDGMEFDTAEGIYQMWRKNRSRRKNGAIGTDLNRNYGYKWGTGGSSEDPGSDVYMGPKPFSEPETLAFKGYVESHDNISIVLSFHTFSELVLYPWGHQFEKIGDQRDFQVHQIMAKKMAEWNGYQPDQSSSLYIASGEMMDWCYGEQRIISFTFELDPKNSWGGPGFYPSASIIPSVMAKNWEPFLYLMSYADNPYRVLDSSFIYGSNL